MELEDRISKNDKKANEILENLKEEGFSVNEAFAVTRWMQRKLEKMSDSILDNSAITQ